MASTLNGFTDKSDSTCMDQRGIRRLLFRPPQNKNEYVQQSFALSTLMQTTATTERKKLHP